MSDVSRATDLATTEHPRLDWHLDNWARYMRTSDVDLACATSDYWSGGYITTFDELADGSELRCAQAVDALVSGLVLIERVAVYHMHLGAVWRLNRANINEVYRSARESLSDGLRARAIW